MSRFTDIADVHDFLEAVPKFQSSGVKAARFALEPMREACELLGNPEQRFKSIHVAGTNGKGTTCFLLSEIYRNAGYKAGLYTSPHLLRYSERFQINGAEIADSALLALMQELDEKLELNGFTYFEISTLLAFLYFAKQQVDIAIIETGLGGRLDSTNIITPQLSVITSISKDHTDILGDTPAEIATEKAGIIKENVPVLIGNIDEKSRKVISEIALKQHSDLHVIDDLEPEFEKGFTLKIKNKRTAFGNALTEPVNKYNIALAWKAAELCSDHFPVAEDGVLETIKNLKAFPARFEKLLPKKEWYFSGSHNTEALKWTVEAINTLKKQRKPIIFCSLMKDKANNEMLSLLNDFEDMYFFEQKTERAATFEHIIRAIAHIRKLEDEAVLEILNECRSELVIFVGSFYFYAIVKGWMEQIKT